MRSNSITQPLGTPTVLIVAATGLLLLPMGCSDNSAGGSRNADAGVTERPLCEVDPCANDTCDQSMISCPDAPPPGEPEAGSDLQPDRIFDCSADATPNDQPMAEVNGLEGAFISLRTAAEGCQFDLVYHAVDGAKTVISDVPSGYLFPAAKRLENGDVLVCVNAVQHRIHEPNSMKRFIERVPIRCTRQHEGQWTPMVSIVTPDGPWAAWLHPASFGDPAAIPGDDENDQFPIKFARDFSFQFLNTIDTGRPGVDGYYRLSLDLSAGRLAVSSQPIKISSIAEGSVPAAETDAAWEPTEAEIAEFEAFIDQLPDNPEPPMEGAAQ